jgi:hypothetical protein
MAVCDGGSCCCCCMVYDGGSCCRRWLPYCDPCTDAVAVCACAACCPFSLSCCRWCWRLSLCGRSAEERAACCWYSW